MGLFHWEPVVGLTTQVGVSRRGSGSGSGSGSSVSDWRHSDGAALGLSWTLPVNPERAGLGFSKQSSLKCSLHMVISVQDDSLKRCLLAVARNWTHSSLFSGSAGNLKRCALRRHESHPTTEHIPDLSSDPPGDPGVRLLIHVHRTGNR